MALPIRDVRRPSCLSGRDNGKLPQSILSTTPGLAGGPGVVLVLPAARAWRALAAAALKVGHTLKATSVADSYRSYQRQESLFRARYRTRRIDGQPRAYWQGQWWWLLPGYAQAAVPGTSNHGWGLAVDVGEEHDGDQSAESLDATTLAWLTTHADDFGWSWELQSEPWHVHYFAGDHIPQAVLDFEEDDDMQLTDKMPVTTWEAKRWADLRTPDGKPSDLTVAVALRSGYGHARAANEQSRETLTQLAALAAEVSALRTVIEQLAAALTSGGGSVDTAAVLAGIDERIGEFKRELAAAVQAQADALAGGE